VLGTKGKLMNTGCSCLSLIFGFIAFIFLIKFWFILLIILLGIYLFNRGQIQGSMFEKKERYESKPGEVYKVCPHCNSKADRRADFCDNCKRAIE